MSGIGNLLVLLLACLAAGALGDYRGRKAERIRMFKQYGVNSGSALRKQEANIRRSLGMRQLPANPDEHPRQHAARIRR